MAQIKASVLFLTHIVYIKKIFIHDIHTEYCTAKNTWIPAYKQYIYTKVHWIAAVFKTHQKYMDSC